jgi:hypothetical protein
LLNTAYAPDLLAGVAENIDYGAIFVKRGAPAPSGGSTRNSLYFFARQLAGAHAIQYSVLLGLLHDDLLLLTEMVFLALSLMLKIKVS